MKKIIILLVSIMFAWPTFAQTKIYCELLGTQVPLSKKVTVSVDFGQKSKLFSNDTLVDENGKAIVFNSMVDAMNYMGTMGWEFEQAYVVTIGSGSSVTNVYHWLLSKYVDGNGESANLKTVNIVNKEKKAAAASEQAAVEAATGEPSDGE